MLSGLHVSICISKIVRSYKYVHTLLLLPNAFYFGNIINAGMCKALVGCWNRRKCSISYQSWYFSWLLYQQSYWGVSHVIWSTFSSEPKSVDSVVRYVWRIPNFSKIKERRVYSDVFSIVGQKWKLVVYPRGSKGDDNCMYSFYTWQTLNSLTHSPPPHTLTYSPLTSVVLPWDRGSWIITRRMVHSCWFLLFCYKSARGHEENSTGGYVIFHLHYFS